MLPALQRAVDHPDMTEDLAAILTTSTVAVEHRVETGVNVHGKRRTIETDERQD